MAKSEQGASPRKASNADLENKKLPLTLYEVVQTFVGDKFVRAEVKPITVIRFGIDRAVGATSPSISFLAPDGETCRGSVSMFYLEEGDAQKEVEHLMSIGHQTSLVMVNQLTGVPVSGPDECKASAVATALKALAPNQLQLVSQELEFDVLTSIVAELLHGSCRVSEEAVEYAMDQIHEDHKRLLTLRNQPIVGTTPDFL